MVKFEIIRRGIWYNLRSFFTQSKCQTQNIQTIINMCGIYFHAKKSNCFCFSEQNLKSVLRLNSYRGPNDEDIHTVQSKNWELQFNGFLLWLRGTKKFY